MIIGITGTLGAGKGTVVDYLVKQKSFRHYSVRGFLIKEIEKRGLPVNRDSMVVVANDLRASFSPSYITDCLYDEAVAVGDSNAVIESIRAVGEITSLRAKGNFTLWAVDALPELRYKRIVGRGSETDHITYEKFLADEATEMESTDPTKQNLKACMALADHTFTNNGSVADLEQAVAIQLQNL